ncbi:MAG: hypothetical protein JWR83_2484, partial [Aeromicrobium sp.]|nr:hypothetical protein [Aeromicrobium sp.]
MTLRRQFYEFGPTPFRDELLVEYLRPAATWFLGDSGAYLIPQVSGSNWECALAVEGLLDLLETDPALESVLRSTITEKSLATVRWMLGQLDWVGSDACTWDGVTWDTAVCARVLLIARDR